MMNSDACQTIEELSLMIGCLWFTVQDHFSRFEKLYMQRIWVSRNWRRRHSLNCVTSMRLFCFGMKPNVTGDKKWILYNNPARRNKGFLLKKHLFR
ncbi:hypothetical protein NPIL_410671 [Nephila pilipes]|uniref:Uncharacterized protein n=1 Tax=Nephila pilipes TaxID=299642 RepID=A0A8X6M954_NEPPI|nr:hypothetical protein NPIL_410671 [Nephila pilipes]